MCVGVHVRFDFTDNFFFVHRRIPAHPNVVLFRGVTIPPDPFTIVTDYCPDGSLFDLLQSEKKISARQKMSFINDIAKGESERVSEGARE